MKNHKIRGFTLIELLIVVAVVAILAAIAFPSYQDSVIRSRRAEGKGFLLLNQQRIERLYTELNNYASAVASTVGAGGVISEHGYYQVTAVAATPNSYTLQSVPLTMADSKCNVLTITEASIKGVSGAAYTSAQCW